MAALSIILLLLGVAGAVSRPHRLPAWALSTAGCVIAVAAGAISPAGAARALRPLAAPIGFLLAAVPLAILLDRLGFFSSLADVLARRRRGAGALWVLGALVVTILNLDAGVVLLTPLYVGFARRTGRDPFALAAQPVLLACLASSALPVSNLTNLIAQSETGAATGAFLVHLGLPSLAACTVGWWRYRQVLPDVVGTDATPAAGTGAGGGGVAAPPAVDTRRALRVGGAIVVAVLVGFTVGDAFGIEPWTVALAGDALLLLVEALTGRVPERTRRPPAVLPAVPWRDIPIGTALVAASLGVLAAAAVAHLPVGRLVGGSSVAAVARTAGVTAAAANVVNNLPALLISLPAVGHHPSPALWAVLIGVNMGPVVLATGSLASLLWLDTVGRLGVPVRARSFTAIGVRIGLPAAAAGLAVELAMRAAGV